MIEEELRNTMDIRQLFNRWTLGEELYAKLMDGKEGKMLDALGFTRNR